MKILTLNFLTCARKACKPHASSFPLHPSECTLEIIETDLNLQFLINILPRLEWPALVTMTTELGIPGLQSEAPEAAALVATDPKSGVEAGEKANVEEGMEVEGVGVEEEKKAVGYGEGEKEPSQLAKDLHRLLLETTIQEGKLVCAYCEHAYAVKEGIANFLLPSHLV